MSKQTWYCYNCGPIPVTALNEFNECASCREDATTKIPPFVLAMQEEIAGLNEVITYQKTRYGEDLHSLRERIAALENAGKALLKIYAPIKTMNAYPEWKALADAIEVGNE